MPTNPTTPKPRDARPPAETAPPGEPRQVATEPDPVIVQAKRDLDAGLVDTDMRQTPGLDAAQRKRLVPTPTTPSDGHADRPPRRVPRSAAR